jgi:MSHA biogenesis protein MshL
MPAGSRRYMSALLFFALAGCATVHEKPALPAIQEEMLKATQAAAARPAPLPAAVEAALAPDAKLVLPKAAAQPVEPRFDLAVNNAPAQQVFMGIASGTRYSMLLHPEVAGSITVHLKDVTVPEAMSALRELYGYDYRIDGNQILVQPLTAQTRFYAIAYPTAVRQGRSELRVISGAVTDSGGAGSTPGAPAQTSRQLETSRLSTDEKSDFWGELQAGVGMLVGCTGQAGALTCPPNHNVMTSPLSGMLAVRALPAEQRMVNDYLKAAKISVERQVMIEAKIIEVSLNEGAQTGINWAALGSSHASPFALSSNYGGATFPSTSNPFLNTIADFGVLNQAANGSLVGLAFQTDSFAALVHFLESQGQVQVLSSPRIAAINNQKAVLKVGTDEFYVTNVSTTTNTGTGSGTTTPNVTLEPFFSGISLDVTPQIDDAENIILHVHPSVSYVTEAIKNIALGGSGLSSISLPLAVSQISETDSVVRLKNGEIAAIGGLMKRETRDDGNGVPGLGDLPLIGALFKSSNKNHRKQELVILIKPTLIRQQSDWLDSARETDARLRQFDSGK